MQWNTCIILHWINFLLSKIQHHHTFSRSLDPPLFTIILISWARLKSLWSYNDGTKKDTQRKFSQSQLNQWSWLLTCSLVNCRTESTCCLYHLLWVLPGGRGSWAWSEGKKCDWGWTVSLPKLGLPGTRGVWTVGGGGEKGRCSTKQNRQERTQGKDVKEVKFMHV